ncbi:MAG: PadR family transcriptional regulator [Candidatus Kerfeldbacteria bacterium]|nr:PadR family transcriptional regulator [Candidatus Kerfeldbacteria bacterium]
MKISKELLKGSLDVAVLAVLAEESLYGYEIAKRIKQLSNELFMMGEGTLYPILHKLEAQHWVESYWQEVDGRKRKYYTLTKQGKKALQEKREEWNEFSAAVNTILSS